MSDRIVRTDDPRIEDAASDPDRGAIPYTPPPGIIPYTVMVAFRVEAQSAEAAVNLVRDNLNVADMGHDLGPVSGTWSITSARKGDQ